MIFRRILLFTAISVMIIFTSCTENKVDVPEIYVENTEPDAIDYSKLGINEMLFQIASEVTSSDQIENNQTAKFLIGEGEKVIPLLIKNFIDSTETTIFSSINKRNLVIGELAIILAGEIKPIPIAKVIGIQQCTPPFDMKIESYLWKIRENPVEFMLQYTKWMWKMS